MQWTLSLGLKVLSQLEMRQVMVFCLTGDPGALRLVVRPPQGGSTQERGSPPAGSGLLPVRSRGSGSLQAASSSAQPGSARQSKDNTTTAVIEGRIHMPLSHFSSCRNIVRCFLLSRRVSVIIKSFLHERKRTCGSFHPICEGTGFGFC